MSRKSTMNSIGWKWHTATRGQNGYFKYFIDGDKTNNFNNIALIKPITALQSLAAGQRGGKLLTTNILDSLTSDEIDFVMKNIDHLIDRYK